MFICISTPQDCEVAWNLDRDCAFEFGLCSAYPTPLSEGGIFSLPYDNRLLAQSVMHICIRGLPSRIFNAAHTSKFITPMTDGALSTKHGLSESFNRLTGLRSPLKKQHKLGFSQIQLWQFQDQNYGSTTSKSVIQSTYYNSRFSEIRIWISILLVDWSDQLPNWLRRWVFDNRSELDYSLDERNSVAHHYN